MYRNCIFCSAELGTNDVLETFPVGQRLAFDAWRGRLWVVCPRCARWNLSPIEERWEAVEAAEKLFRDARLRVQSENVGLAQLPDGTRLIRVGQAVPGELAAWRYGGQLLQRRKRYLVVSGAGSAAFLGFYSGAAALGFGVFGMFCAGQWLHHRRQQKVVQRIDATADPAGRGVVVRRWHVEGMSIEPADGDRLLAVHVRDAHREKPGWGGTVKADSADVIVLSGEHARALLSRAMVHVNQSGASRRNLDDANRLLSEAGSAEQLLLQTAKARVMLGRKGGYAPDRLRGAHALAFEMALNEEAERRALEGELAALEAAWRDAEEIAAIADALPGEVALNRMLDRLLR